MGEQVSRQALGTHSVGAMPWRGLLFRVKWRLKDIDWPTCMSYIEFVYYDTVYNESVFIHTYDGPFVDKMEFELLNTQVIRKFSIKIFCSLRKI